MLASTVKTLINPLIFFLKKYFLFKKFSVKGTTKDNIKFHMEEMILRKIKLKYTFQLIENRSVTQIDKYRHI